jgi:hypothetical protein
MSAPHAAPLAEAQRRLRGLVAAPGGVAAALAEASPEERRASEALLRAAGGLTGLERLEVYASAYFERIHGVLAECFPALRWALGEALFHDLATAYLISHPPRHASIRRVGDDLPGFLACGAGGAPFRRRAPFAADLASLERARLDAFDAADAPALSREALAAVPPERWTGLRLACAPAVRLLRLAWPAEALWGAHERGEPAPAEVAPSAHAVCVWRRDERVLHRTLDALEADCLEVALEGEPFGALCERIASVRGDSEAPGLAAGHLAGWLDAGLVASIEPGDPAAGVG